MPRSMQDIFLNKLRKGKISCTIITTNGYQIKDAVIVSFDSFSLLIDEKGQQRLVFKHAVSSIAPSQAIDVTDDENTDK